MMNFIFLNLLFSSSYLVDTQNKPIKFCQLPIYYMIMEDMPIRETEVIRLALDDWNYLLGRDLFIERRINEDYTHLIFGMVDYPEDMPQVEHQGITIFDHGYDPGCKRGAVILLNPDVTDKSDVYIDSLIHHEAGHILSLAHQDNPLSLMYWQFNIFEEFKEVEDQDIKLIKELYKEELKHVKRLKKTSLFNFY